MILTEGQINILKQEIITCLEREKEVQKIIIFGSFLNSDDPKDLDVAVFQDSRETYLPLAMKYRHKTRPIARRIPLDIFPVKVGNYNDPFLSEIEAGEVIYER